MIRYEYVYGWVRFQKVVCHDRDIFVFIQTFIQVLKCNTLYNKPCILVSIILVYKFNMFVRLTLSTKCVKWSAVAYEAFTSISTYKKNTLYRKFIYLKLYKIYFSILKYYKV